MTADEVVDELKSLGSEATKRTLMKHGVKEPIFGAKVEDLKKIQKRIKVNYQLALDLYDTGISDAMYLAGLIADDSKMSKKDLQKWVKGAHWSMLSEYTVPWVACGGKFGHELALEWIESRSERIASAGWSTLSSLVAVKPDSELDLGELRTLLKRVETTIHQQPNRVRYCMNGFVIAVGGYVEPLLNEAKTVAKAIGKVSVDMGGTACKVPLALEYIGKIEERGSVGKKRKTAKC